MALAAAGLLASCSTAAPPGSSATTASGEASTGTAASSTPTSSVPTVTPTVRPPTSSATTSRPRGPAACAASIVAGLTPSERAGQLIVVGLKVTAASTSLDGLVRGRHLGGVILLKGWYSGVASVRDTTNHLAGLAGDATGGLGLFVAADQEGGNVQQLRGSGFTRIPTARVQDELSPSQLASRASGWAREMKAAGVNVNLAPVADTVPEELGTANQPIGQWDRQFSSDPVDVARMVAGFVRGMHAGGVAATVKHFPGLGRITGNTDLTATGITDTVTRVDDPYLQPFARGIAEGADFVMVGSAIYSRIDPGVNAVFSSRIVRDLLRGRLGYSGVVITDDVGDAKSVAAVPVGQRATRFVDAGGDVVLTARPSTVGPMHDALTSRMARDPAFAAKVQAAVTRVVTLKVRLGLARCS